MYMTSYILDAKEYYSDSQKKEILPYVITLINPWDMMSDREKQTLHDFT